MILEVRYKGQKINPNDIEIDYTDSWATKLQLLLKIMVQTNGILLGRNVRLVKVGNLLKLGCYDTTRNKERTLHRALLLRE